MCGINGQLRLSPDGEPVSIDEVERIRDQMAARGPDSCGSWIQEDGEIALGHRRLAIIDPSDAGNQPMAWRAGRYRIVHNGEIYNYRELRAELASDGVSFRSESDTEVLLALFERHDLAMLERLRGMFAFAIWDRQRRRLVLARDPYGIKPLYYTNDGKVLRFASQVRALEASAGVSREVDPAGLVGFLLWGSVPDPFTIRRAVRALPAGHLLEVEAGLLQDPVEYSVPEAGRLPDHRHLTPAAAIEDSVRCHLVSDVPVGSFLSSGLDSAVTTAVAARLGSKPLTTLTVRFDDYRDTPLDEAPLAREISRALGTRHREHTVGKQEFLELWPRAIAAMDQPSIDGFNTFVVSTMARREGLKVVLSGLGGDELLGGYPSFRDVPRWHRWARAGALLPGHLSALSLAARLSPRTPKLAGFTRYGRTLAGAYFLRRALFLPEELPELIGRDLAEEGLALYDPVADAARFISGEQNRRAVEMSDWLAVHLMESGIYLRHQLLRDSDWASMAQGLELRVPFVDPVLRSRLAASSFEPARSAGKAALLRKVAPELPRKIWSRPKTGFTIPAVSLLEHADGAPSPPTLGADSRRLAHLVLGEFDVHLGPQG